MIDLERLQSPKPSGVRGAGHTTDGVMTALQTMDVHGGVFYLIELHSMANHIGAILSQFAVFWQMNLERRSPLSWLVDDKFFHLVALYNYEQRTRGSNYPVIIDHWANLIGECPFCRELSCQPMRSGVHRTSIGSFCPSCNRVMEVSRGDDTVIQIVYPQETTHNWNGEGF